MGQNYDDKIKIMMGKINIQRAMLFFIFLFTAAFASMRLLDSSASTIDHNVKTLHRNAISTQKFPLVCSTTLRTCPEKSPAVAPVEGFSPAETCPQYFRWIHEDLAPWRETGISLEMVETAVREKRPHFRLAIVDGKVYVQTFRRPYQTRDVFTQWGILQLLNRYPGRIPDLDMVFYCEDQPQVARECYPSKNGQVAPPAMFGYDGDDVHRTFDIVFPDWSFWGWPETKIKPWESLMRELKEGNAKSRWVDRDPHAYWKGNLYMPPRRKQLIKCNASQNQEWNARVYHQDWTLETKQGFKNSNLRDQCNYRYKIYLEGIGWSVSQKYIMSCDSPTLLVKARYYDFFSRRLVPMKHYWPIRAEELCKSIKFAVDWGNTHQEEAQAMGRAASSMIREELQMKYVYDYMFHLLTAYAKLLTYKPTVPPNAVQLCPESMACPAEGLVKQYMMDSAVTISADTPPCGMPPPYDPPTFRSLIKKKQDAFKQVETWEKQYWAAQNTSN